MREWRVNTDKLEVRITLPRHLAEWLYEFSKSIAMTPDQLIANILQYYYEAWRVGREQSIEGTSCTKILEIISQSFLGTIPKSKYSTVKAILKHYTAWVCRGGFQVDENSINAFLEDYIKSRTGIKRSTIHKYKYILRKFVKFYREQALVK